METTCDNAICKKSDGWYNIEPGNCLVTITGDLDLYGGYGGHKWTGEEQYCVDPSQPFHYWNPDESTCRKVGFREIEIGSDEILGHDKTVNLTVSQ